MQFSMPSSLSEANVSPLQQILADTWCCRSCSEIVGFLAPQPHPSTCPNCRGSRFLPVLEFPRSRALARRAGVVTV